MTLVEKMQIVEFRGIRNMTLNFARKNFAICGPNGTGKSGVVDALEFALTGNISRLSGEGSGEISVREHGPHVDKRNDPGRAHVLVTLYVPSLGKSITVDRNVKSPKSPRITPNDEEILEYLNHLKDHPEITLSRRELIRYVLATPGKRAEEVQALLHLDQVDQVRTNLLKIANSCQRQVGPFRTGAEAARENCLRALQISELTNKAILKEANERRAVLGLPALKEVGNSNSLKDGMSTPVSIKPLQIPKTQALADILAFRELLKALSSTQTHDVISSLIVRIQKFQGDVRVSVNLEWDTFLNTGLSLMGDLQCPFCDDPWDAAELRLLIQTKLNELAMITTWRGEIEAELSPFIQTLRKIVASVSSLAGYAAMATPVLPSMSATAVSEGYRTSCDQLSQLIPLEKTIATLEGLSNIPAPLVVFLDDLERVIQALPDPSRQDSARDWLIVGQERLEVWRESLRKEKAAEQLADRARQISDTYAQTSDSVLSDIYEAVEKDFIALYGFINRGDEDKFTARLIPSLGKLGFDVDFYGRGYFPPGAYHSEGHQDGMGLCLYLALMRYLLGPAFTLAILDDVLMSVDVGHRREVCALLKREFPHTQFIMTTHDPIWLRHMRTEGLIDNKGAVQFRHWSIDQGPTLWDERDVWKEIEGSIAQNDVRAASSLLRHYLEYIAGELCHRLRAKVEFRGDGQFQLGELLPAAVSQLSRLMREAKDAANSWGQMEIVADVSSMADEFARLSQATQWEKWQINSSIHFNGWENLSKNDFEPVVVAFRRLLGSFTCSSCGEFLRVTPDRDLRESIRCECGAVSLNLVKK